MQEDKPLLVKADHQNQSRCYLPCRYVLALLSCAGFCVMYLLRVNLSVALVAMVNSTYTNEKETDKNPECQGNNISRSSLPVDGKFNWDEKTQVPGGWLASRFGGKYLFGFGVLCTSVLTICTPVAANHSVAMIIIVRILEGLGEGVTFPAMHATWSRWAPPLERSKLMTFSYTGAHLGTILGMSLAGVLCASDLTGGWPSVFYIFGAIGVAWFILWMLITHDRPSNHPRISNEEKEYILRSIGAGQDSRQRTFVTPWRDIWLSPAVWAIVVAQFCYHWGFYTFLTYLPTYFKEVLNFPIAQNGVLSAIPFACQYFIGIGAGQVADWLRQSTTLTTGQTRKVFATGGFLIPACLMVSTSYMGCNNKSGIVALFSIALGFAALNMAGYGINHLDISPRFAGVLFGIANTAATIPGIVGPYIVGVLTNNQPTRARWQIVFYISAGIYILGAVTYLLFGSGKEQPWNTPYEDQLVPVTIPKTKETCYGRRPGTVTM